MIEQNCYEIGDEDRGVEEGLPRKNPAFAGPLPIGLFWKVQKPTS